MSLAKQLSHKNIERARHWLPFLSPEMRDLVTLLPALFCEGSESIGILGRITCSHKEFELLKTYLGRKPQITAGRLPDRMPLESLIAVLKPSPASRFNAKIYVLCKTKSQNSNEEVRKKTLEISRVFHNYRISVSFIVFSDTLPELILYDIMRTGFVLGGKYPVTKEHMQSEICAYIGDLPGIITDTTRFISDEWDPFQAFVDQETDLFIRKSDYPAPLFVIGANPFITPYLHILHHYDEKMDAEKVKKLRTSLSFLYSSFPPTVEVLTDLKRIWKMNDVSGISDGKSLANALQLRKWLVPLEENELPVVTWPPPGNISLSSVQLCLDNDLWHLKQAKDFQCRHAWAVLMWGCIAGIITQDTRITTPSSLTLKHDARKRLYDAYKALEQGASIIVPEDHMKGSIQKMGGRFYFSDKPFAILEQGSKHSLEIFEGVKKKALLDDSDLQAMTKSKR